jgi:hypothetical protein
VLLRLTRILSVFLLTGAEARWKIRCSKTANIRSG